MEEDRQGEDRREVKGGRRKRGRGTRRVREEGDRWRWGREMGRERVTCSACGL